MLREDKATSMQYGVAALVPHANQRTHVTEQSAVYLFWIGSCRGIHHNGVCKSENVKLLALRPTSNY